MSDLISRAMLLKALRKEQRECEKDGEEFGGESVLFAEAFEDVIDMVKRFPTVDAVQVVHARWEENRMYYRCTACDTDFDDEIAFIHPGEFHLPTYCPECGAKMDGGAE